MRKVLERLKLKHRPTILPCTFEDWISITIYFSWAFLLLLSYALIGEKKNW